MALPLSNTTITVSRPASDATAGDWVDGYDANPPALAEVQSGVAAMIPPPSASARLAGGDRVVYNATMQCDPCDLQNADIVTDDASGNQWTVLWVTPVAGFLGFDHLTVGLRMVEGFTP